MSHTKYAVADSPIQDEDGIKDDWVERLRDESRRSEAIAELTQLLVRGLGSAIVQRYGNSVSAEDIAQDSILKILDSLDQFRGESQFVSWAMTIATRVGVSELRRKRYQDVSLDSLTQDGLPIEPSWNHDSFERRIDQDIIRLRISDLIETKLTQRQQVCMRALLAGVPIEVIAEKMSSNRNAIYKLIHDGRARLRDGFAERGITADQVVAVFSKAH